MQFVYPAIFHKEDDGYWVEFPDLKGCVTQGDNVSDTLFNAQEALTGFLLVLLEENKALPAPRGIGDIAPVEDGFSTLVSCSFDTSHAAKAVKKTLTIPSWLNDRALSLGINFSKTLQEALLDKIQA